MKHRYLVFIVSSVLFDQCQIIARSSSEDEARAVIDTWRKDNPSYHGEIAIVEVLDVLFLDLA